MNMSNDQLGADRLGCPGCGEPVARDDRFCETCGRSLLVRRTPPGGPEVRDRVEWDFGAVTGVSDRGNRRTRNEDSMAFAVLFGERGPGTVVVVVCDGVATSDHGERASQAAVDAACDVLLDAALDVHQGPIPTRAAITATHLAVDRAQAAVAALGDPDRAGTAPSCTYVSAVVTANEVTVGWLGDSRAYWLSSAAGQSRRLTADDTVADELIAAGLPVEVANGVPQAHALSKWLGLDAEQVAARISTFIPDGAGHLLLCSDGLWNYLPAPDELAAVLAASAGTTPLKAASAAVRRALDLGGHDNITCVLVPIPFRNEV
jgi:serine/threonine protein phosphatase PrpC